VELSTRNAGFAAVAERIRGSFDEGQSAVPGGTPARRSRLAMGGHPHCDGAPTSQPRASGGAGALSASPSGAASPPATCPRGLVEHKLGESGAQSLVGRIPVRSPVPELAHVRRGNSQGHRQDLHAPGIARRFARHGDD